MHAVIITGVSRGLGEALAATLLAQGATIVGIGRSAGAKLSGNRYRHVTCDLSRPAAIAASVVPALRALAAEHPESVTLINNAAVATPVGRIGRLDAGEIETSILTNVVAPLVVADLFCRAFADAPGTRRIINVSSGAAQSALAGSAVYCVSKAALEMLTHSLVAECAEAGIECVTLRPGIFDTQMQAFMRSLDPKEYPSVDLFRGFKENGLLKDPAEVAAAIARKLVFAPVENGRTYTHADL